MTEESRRQSVIQTRKSTKAQIESPQTMCQKASLLLIESWLWYEGVWRHALIAAYVYHLSMSHNVCPASCTGLNENHQIIAQPSFSDLFWPGCFGSSRFVRMDVGFAFKAQNYSRLPTWKTPNLSTALNLQYSVLKDAPISGSPVKESRPTRPSNAR